MGEINLRVLAGLPRTLVALAGLAGVVLLASGCGSARPRVAAIGTTTARNGSGRSSSDRRDTGPPVVSAGRTSGSAGAPSGNSTGRASYALMRGSVRQMTKFAACVRSHGAPNFPDPNRQGQFSMSAVTAAGIDPRSPQLERAVQTCANDLPNGATAAPSPAEQARAREQGLAFSACMRSHGEPNFPDPPSGGAAIRILPGSGIDPRSPQYQTATMACGKHLGKTSKTGPSAGS